ncbi:glucose-1-phosphate adenylyltransferase [Verrucomicrobiales bacterium]|nr:glucose-1-phosphate adenylyltransferase [Verrucomicrobiales bacterium]
MPKDITSSVQDSTLAIIMGGGQGTRLSPLTDRRAKPAVPLAGKYRLVDIPISNCLNSGIRQMYVLTQFNTESLHRHITDAYKFDAFTESFVHILAAQQTPGDDEWYQGTADAVRQNLEYFMGGAKPFKYFLILSGDQLYRMDFKKMLAEHIERDAKLTIATTPVDREDARAFGLMHTDDDSKITRFVEKPGDNNELLDELTMPASLLAQSNIAEDEERFQASIGIYLFNRSALEKCLDNDFKDFGKNIIPKSIEDYNVYSHVFQGYWEDIGTIGSYHEANVSLTDQIPSFNFFEEQPIYTRARFLPTSKINGATIKNGLVSDGCIIEGATITRSLIGVRTVLRYGCHINNSVILGADYYHRNSVNSETGEAEEISIEIGENVIINDAIIDKNVTIGRDVVIQPDDRPDGKYEYCVISDGIVVIPKSTRIPAGTRV